MKKWALVLACMVIFGPERFPLDGGMHTEFRVTVCTETWWSGHESAVVVESRTYERVPQKDGRYITTVLSAGEDGWTEAGQSVIYCQPHAPSDTR